MDVNDYRVNDYRTCMSNKMKGNLKDLSKTERKIYFSTSAKLCSNKATNENAARKLVKIDHPEWFDEQK